LILYIKLIRETKHLFKITNKREKKIKTFIFFIENTRVLTFFNKQEKKKLFFITLKYKYTFLINKNCKNFRKKKAYHSILVKNFTPFK
jgi:hypothetical protein